jgi:plasmid stabilization system protein ParE
MRLVFDDQALADLAVIFEWIARDSPATAKSVVDRLFSSTELLISFPMTIVTAVLHGAQDREGDE